MANLTSKIFFPKLSILEVMKPMSTKIKKLLSLFILGSFLIVFPWQTIVATEKYDLEKCIQLAIKFRPELTYWQARIDSSIAATKASKFLYLPSLSFSLKAEELVRTLYPSLRDQEFRYGDISLRFDQPIYQFGRISNQIRSSKATLATNELNYLREILRIRKEMSLTFFRIQYYIDYVKLLEELIKTSEDIVFRTKEMHDSGYVPKVDYLRNYSRLLFLKRSLMEAKIDLETEENILKERMGLRIDIPIEIVPFSEKERALLSLEEVKYLALQNNPEIKIKETNIQKAEYDTDIIKAKLKPEINLYGTLLARPQNGIINSPDGVPGLNYSSSLGVYVSIPIFKDPGIFPKIAEKKHIIRFNQEDLEKLKLQLMVDTDDSYLNIQNAQNIIPTLEEQKTLDWERLLLERDRYFEGLTSSIAVDNATFSYLQTSRLLVQALRDINIGYAELDYLTGRYAQP